MANTLIKKCVNCDKDLHETSNYQLIFDEIGRELNLQQLLLDCFHITIEYDSKTAALCTDCVNDLIAEYDAIERNREFESRPEFTDETMKAQMDDSLNLDQIKTVEHDVSAKQGQHGGQEHKIATQLNTTDFDGTSESKTTAFGEGFIEVVSGSDQDDDDQIDQVEVLHLNEDLGEKCVYESEGGGDEEMLNNPGDVGSTKLGDEQFESHGEVHLEELEEIDLNEYVKKILNWRESSIPHKIECHYCMKKLHNHAEIIKHITEAHVEDESSYPCIANVECTWAKSVEDLAVHLITKHYNLQRMELPVVCPECGTSFKNFNVFNKHSCLADKNVSRLLQFCGECELEFTSNRRYRFHLQFHLDKHRPKACFLCWKTFRYEDQFYEHIMYAHDGDNMELVCTKCDLRFTSDENLQKHLKLHSVVRRYHCYECNRAYSHKHMLDDHLRTYHSADDSLQCKICEKRFSKRHILNKHMKFHAVHVKSEFDVCSECGLVAMSSDSLESHICEQHESEASARLETLKLTMLCEYCGSSFNTIENLRAHRSAHVSGEFTCEFCPVVYKEFKKMQTHKKSHKAKQSSWPILQHYVCSDEDCSATYVQWSALRKHVSVQHSKIIQCPKCEKEFSNKVMFKNHMDASHGGVQYRCELCKKDFVSQTALSVHKARSHNQSKVRCDHCNTFHKDIKTLESHIAYLHTELSCHICLKSVKNAKNLKLHMDMVHKEVKRFFCQYCKKGYYNNCDRVEHERTSHGANNNCRQCEKSFRWKFELIAHEKLHNSKEGFEHACKERGASINLKKELKNRKSSAHTFKRKKVAHKPSPSTSSLVGQSDVYVDDDDGLEAEFGVTEGFIIEELSAGDCHVSKNIETKTCSPEQEIIVWDDDADEMSVCLPAQ